MRETNSLLQVEHNLFGILLTFSLSEQMSQLGDWNIQSIPMKTNSNLNLEDIILD